MTLPNNGLVAFTSEDNVVLNIVLMENPTEEKINTVLEVSPAYFEGIDLSNYAYPVGLGAVWNGTVFTNPKPPTSIEFAGFIITDNDWVLNEATGQWSRPIPYPVDENTYRWSFSEHDWEVVSE